MKKKVIYVLIALAGLGLIALGIWGVIYASSVLFTKPEEGVYQNNILMIPLFFLGLSGIIVGGTFVIINFHKIFHKERYKRYRK